MVNVNKKEKTSAPSVDIIVRPSSGPPSRELTVNYRVRQKTDTLFVFDFSLARCIIFAILVYSRIIFIK